MKRQKPRKGPSKARARKAMKAFRASLKKFDQPSAPRRTQTRGPRIYRALYVIRSDSIVKLGITSNVDARLAQHRKQGLTKVVYVLHSSDSGAIVQLEKSWKDFVRSHPTLRIGREELPDGYTEALLLNEMVRVFVDRLLKGIEQRE